MGLKEFYLVVVGRLVATLYWYYNGLVVSLFWWTWSLIFCRFVLLDEMQRCTNLILHNFIMYNSMCHSIYVITTLWYFQCIVFCPSLVFQVVETVAVRLVHFLVFCLFVCEDRVIFAGGGLISNLNVYQFCHSMFTMFTAWCYGGRYVAKTFNICTSNCNWMHSLLLPSTLLVNDV